MLNSKGILNNQAPVRFYFIAGERSGDLHAGNLIKSIKQLQPDSRFRGFGGDYMQAQGMELVMHYRELAFMGVIQVILNLRKISDRMKTCKSDILTWKPDAVILVDYGGFNMQIAKFLKKEGIRTIYYISPKVWAWNTGRAWKLKASVDRLLCILPFEKDFFRRFDWEVDYVGNPVLDAVKSFRPDTSFRQRHGLENREIVALLPGSRKIELRRIIPLMAGVAAKFPSITFVVGALRELPQELYEPLRQAGNVRFVYEETYDLLSNAKAAIVTSGTATLETGLFNVPQVVVYKATALEYAVGSRIVDVKYISLVNLIADASVVRELLQNDASVETVCGELQKLINPGEYRDKVLDGYLKVRELLDTGSASDNAARIICGVAD